MKTLFGIVVLTIGFTSFAQAGDFTGYWTGTGVMTRKDLFTGNQTSPCDKIEIWIEHVPEKMTIQRYRGQCGMIDSDWGPIPMEIRDTKVYEDDEETGTFENDLLKTLTHDGGVAYAFNLRLLPATEGEEGALPVLESYYGVKNLLGTIVIEGNLNPAEPPAEEKN